MYNLIYVAFLQIYISWRNTFLLTIFSSFVTVPRKYNFIHVYMSSAYIVIVCNLKYVGLVLVLAMFFLRIMLENINSHLYTCKVQNINCLVSRENDDVTKWENKWSMSLISQFISTQINKYINHTFSFLQGNTTWYQHLCNILSFVCWFCQE